MDFFALFGGQHGSSLWKKLRFDDDFCDYLNSRYTALILLTMAVLVSARQYVGDPINCWTPNEFNDQWIKYTDDYCWLQNSYFLPFNENIPEVDAPRPLIAYYQWVPFILLLQAFLFYLPTVVWRLLSDTAGVNIHSMTKMINSKDYLNPEKRSTTVKFLVRNMDKYFTIKNHFNGKHGKKGTSTCCFIGKRHGNFLAVLNLVCKVLYVTNAVGQIFLLNAFLGTAFHVYGFDVIDDFIHNRDWTVNGRFPRVTLCDFKVRRLGHNVQRYTVQCVLPVNMFNEKIFMFLWFWFVIVSAATTLGFFAWLSDLLPSRRRHFIRKHLKVTGSLSPADADLCNEFVHDYLYLDGVFTLRLIGRNSNTIILAEFISQLWYYYRKKYKGIPLILKDSDEELEETENDKKESLTV